jgi:hypothetical protein
MDRRWHRTKPHKMDAHAPFGPQRICILSAVISIFSGAMSLSSQLDFEFPVLRLSYLGTQNLHAPKSKKNKKAALVLLHPRELAKRTDPLNTILVIGNLPKTFVLSRTRTHGGWCCWDCRPGKRSQPTCQYSNWQDLMK